MTETPLLHRDTVKAALIVALEENLGRKLPEVTEATSLFDELALDSTGVLAVLISLEDSLGIEIDAEAINEEHLATLGGLVTCVCDTGQR